MLTDPITFKNSVNLDHVILLRRSGSRQLNALLTNGDATTLDESDVSNALRTKVQQMVPALPGTFVIGMTDGAKPEEWRRAVIAWAVSADGLVYPVTLEGIGVDGRAEDVLFPDGRVERFDQIWNSLSEWAHDARIAAKKANAD